MACETNVLEQADLTLDLFDSEDQPAPNKFHVADSTSVELITSDIKDSKQLTYLDVSTAKESVVESKIVKSEIPVDALDSKVEADEDDSSSSSSSEEAADTNFKEYIEQTVPTSNQDETKCTAILDKDEDEEEEDRVSVGIPKTFSRIAKKLMFEWDLEEIDEEIDEEMEAEEFEESESAKLTSASAAEMASTEALLKKAKSKLMLRATSVLEQRLKTISDLKGLFEDRKKLAFKNRFLNDKCCDYLKKIKTTVNYFESTEGSMPIHRSQRYYNVLEEYMDTKIHYDNTKPSLEEETQKLTDSYYICRARFEQVFGNFTSLELEVGAECIDGKTGRLMSVQKIDSLVKKQHRKFDQLAEVRVHYLKLNNFLADIHKNLRALNAMGEGHTLMEYEQLVIINNTSMDKLDEREEELQKLRDKCTENISILSCMKETLEALAHDIVDAAAELEEITKKKIDARSFLASQCLRRDVLRKDILKIHSVTGLLAIPKLLGQMEVDSAALAVLEQNVNTSTRGTVNLTRSDTAVPRSGSKGKETNHHVGI